MVWWCLLEKRCLGLGDQCRLHVIWWLALKTDLWSFKQTKMPAGGRGVAEVKEAVQAHPRPIRRGRGHADGPHCHHELGCEGKEIVSVAHLLLSHVAHLIVCRMSHIKKERLSFLFLFSF